MSQRYNPQTGQMEDDGYNDMGKLALADTNTIVADPNKPAPLAPEGTTVVPAAMPAPEPSPAPAAPSPGAAAPAPGQTFALPAAAPMPVAPARVMETEGTSTTTSGIDKASRRAIQAATAERQGVLAEQQKQIAAAGAVAKDEATDVAANAAEKERLARQQAGETERAIAEGKAAYDRAMQTYQQDYERWQKADIKDFYAGDAGKSRALWSAMTIALGGLAQGKLMRAQVLAGGVPNAQNEGVGIVKDLIARDYNRQKEAIEKQRQIMLDRRADAQRVQDDTQHALNLARVKHAAQADVTAAQMASMLAARGATKAEIASNQQILAVRDLSAQLKAETAKETATHVQSTVQKRLTEQTGGAAKGAAPNGATGFEVFDPNSGQVVGMAPTKEAAAKANDRLVKLKEAREHIANLRNSFNKEGTQYSNLITPWDSDAYKFRKKERDAAAQTMTGPGDHQKDDFERFVRQIGTDFDLKSANPTRLDAADADIAKQVDDTLASVGIRKGVAGRVVRGEAVPVEQKMPPINPAEVGALILRARQGDVEAQKIIRGMRERGIQF